MGRAQELSAIEALLAEVGAGTGRLALLTGEPGIGKSRLTEEAVRRGASSGWFSAWGRSWEGAGTPAYWPWTQLLRRMLAVPAMRSLVAGAELGALLEPGVAAAVPSDAEHARFLLFDRVSRLIHAAAEQQPLLLVLDDIHAADAATLMLLQFVARGLRGSRALIIAAARDSSFTASAGVHTLLAQIAREAHHIALDRLSRELVGEWLARAAPDLDADKVWATTEGNPLFVSELLAAAKKRPDLAWTAEAMPAGIREAIRAHLALVSDGALKLLETASVLGRELPALLLKAVANASEADGLDEALASDVLRDAGDGRLRFSHVLLRDELYARLPGERRRALHRRAAHASESREAAAHHALLAADSDDTSMTLKFVHAAMVEASSRLAHDDAASLGQRALAALEQHLTPAEVCALLVAIAEAQVLAGDLARGKATGERAAALAMELGLTDLLARAVLTRAVEIDFGGDRPLVALIRRTLTIVPAADSPVRAELMARLAAALNNDPTAAAEQRLQRDGALAMARRLGDERTLFVALFNAAGMFPEELTPQQRHALYAEMVDLAERTGTIGKVAPLFSWYVVSWLELGDPGGAWAAADRVERLLANYAQPHYRWRVPLIRATLCAVAGRFAEADALAAESLEIARAHGLRDGLMMHAIYMSCLPYVRGDEGGLSEFFPSIEPVLQALPLGQIFKAMWEAPLGRAAGVRQSMALLQEVGVENVYGAFQLGWCIVRAGIAELAEFFYVLALQIPPTLPLAFSPGGCCVGPKDLMVGQLAAMTGRRAEAAERLKRALGHSRLIESPSLIAQCELALAELLATDDPTAASAHAQVALDEASRVGIAALVSRAQALLERAPAQPAPARAGAPALSLRRNGDIWSLQGNGRSLTLVHSKGVAYLAALVTTPHRQVHVLELSGIGEDGDAGHQIDEKARDAYRARAEELRAELEQVDAFNDFGRRERIQHELDRLGAELARAFGLGGRERKAGSVADRARINVQRRLRDTIRRVDEQDKALGRHLELSVRTGLFCLYAPTWPAG